MAWGEANGNCATRTDIEVGTTQPMDGIECTKKLATDSHSHPAAKFCYNFWDENLALDQDGKPDLITYILPSTGQWQLALKGITGKDFKNLVNGADLIKAINDLYQKSGVTSSTYSYLTKDFENTNTISFWTSTEASDTEAYVLTINKNTGVVFEKKPKSEKHRVLPFIIYG
jgi:hypothetical protein